MNVEEYIPQLKVEVRDSEFAKFTTRAKRENFLLPCNRGLGEYIFLDELE